MVNLPRRLAPPSSARRASRGFTLLELMIAVVVLAIVAAVAIPSYSDYVRRAARSDAQLALMEASQYIERVYTECNNYTLRDASTDPPCTAVFSALPTELTRAPKEGTQRYAITLLGLAAQSYVLRATPLQADDCGAFELRSTGVKVVVGASLPAEQCWRR